MSQPRDPRRRLPQVDRLVRQVQTDGLPHAVVVDVVRDVIAMARKSGEGGKETELIAAANAELHARRRRILQPVINATGVVLHTNLGRAPLSKRAIDAVVDVARGYSNLEWDANTGRRGDRYAHAEPLLALATGAEAALVVNNNAAAVLLACAALASGREVVVSRGELVEIGGGFRIPEVLAQSGATLREVGTTNRTRSRDYENAIVKSTAAILKVHPSNYEIVGFTESVPAAELAVLAKRWRIPFVYDVGSGLLDRPSGDEPVVTEAVRSGADLVCFSGDKLLGGPQAGIVVGRRRIVQRLRTHPLLRALRADKMQLAALSETVLAYLEGAADELPVRQMLDADSKTLERRARKLGRHLQQFGFEVMVVTRPSVAGGGSLPGQEIPSPVLLVRSLDRSAADVAAVLRNAEPPVVARVEGGRLIVDLRTVPPRQDAAVVAAFQRIPAFEHL